MTAPRLILPTAAAKPSRISFRRYWLALYRRDVPAAEAIVEAAIAAWRPARVYLRLFAPALSLSGRLFARGAIGYRDEHFITHHTLRLMRPVRRMLLRGGDAGGARRSPFPDRLAPPVALATGVAGEAHGIGLSMVCDFVARDGWNVVRLHEHLRGAFERAVEQYRPAAVLLSVNGPRGLAAAAQRVHRLRRDGYPGTIAVGGRAIDPDPPARLAEVGGDLTAPHGLELVRLFRRRGIGAC